MKYEQLNDQAKDAQNAVKFLPKSMVAAITKDKTQKGRRESPEVEKEFVEKMSKPRDLGFTPTPINIERERIEKRNEGIALSAGSIFIILLVYFLFLR